MEGFLPPKPAGPEPELGGRPAPAQPPPPPAYGQAPPGAWQQPQPPAQQVPDNGPAVAGFVFSLVAGGLLFVTAGLSTLVSLGCAIAGILYARKGKRNVDTGVTPRHGSLARAGFVIGWISLALAILATIAWTLALVLWLTSDDFQRELERELDNRTAVMVAAQAVRQAAHLLA